MGKWAQAEEDGCCYNCDEQVGYENIVSQGGWPVCETCAFELEREEESDDW